MKIDSKVEDPLRRAFVAVVDSNADGIRSSLEPLDEEQTGLAVGYAAFVVAFVMNDVHESGVDAEVADVMAEDVIGGVSGWLDLGTRSEVAAFLLACATNDSEFSGAEPNEVVTFSIAIAGYLVAWYSPEDMPWWKYLDQIWNFAESQPDPA